MNKDKIVPTDEALRAIVADPRYADRSDVELYQLAQAQTLIDEYYEQFGQSKDAKRARRK